ncbi:hypothetical protein KPL76_04855 [Subtercola sp. PAMC28395]|uniref:hypothetical protein n=1 Tax=Subtercola sp. PAMC28395 TaxID=2846775 RepID=UPI001C0CC3E6|nr:hypothetical protein [Subtercola sp. PAMC28395]QWT24708.1 hypothetical protein KPL76_04855 [Subtercola sp. PAMC28395]
MPASSSTYSVGVARLPRSARNSADPQGRRVPANESGSTSAPAGHDHPGAKSNSWWRRAPERIFGAPSRIIAIDVTRGLALVSVVVLLAVPGLLATGATGAAVRSNAPLDPGGVPGTPALPSMSGFEWSASDSWVTLVPAVVVLLFAVSSGISVSLAAGGHRLLTGVHGVQVRLRLLFRAVICFSTGAALVATSDAVSSHSVSPALGIQGELVAQLAAQLGQALQVIAALTALSIVVVRLPVWVLFTVSGIVAVVPPIVSSIVGSIGSDTSPFISQRLSSLGLDPSSFARSVFASSTLGTPTVLWAALFFVGLALAKLNLARVRTRLVVLGAGFLAAGICFGTGWALGHSSASLPWALGTLTNAPATSNVFAFVGVSGSVITVVAVLLLVAPLLRWGLIPLATTGSLAATASFLVLGGAAITDAVTRGGLPANAVLIGVAALPVFCTLWRLLLGRGPLERLGRSIERFISAEAPTEDGAEPKSSEGRAAQPASPEPRAARPPRVRESKARGLVRQKRPARREAQTTSVALPSTDVGARTSWSPGETLGRSPF